jgi:hypothetical protein
MRIGISVPPPFQYLCSLRHEHARTVGDVPDVGAACDALSSFSTGKELPGQQLVVLDARMAMTRCARLAVRAISPHLARAADRCRLNAFFAPAQMRAEDEAHLRDRFRLKALQHRYPELQKRAANAPTQASRGQAIDNAAPLARLSDIASAMAGGEHCSRTGRL